MWKQFIRLMNQAGEGSDGGGGSDGGSSSGSSGDGAGSGSAGNLMGGGSGSSASGDAGSQGAGNQGSGDAGNQEGSSSGGSFKLNIYDDDGKVDPAFMDSLGDENKGVGKIFSKYTNTEDAIKGIANLAFMAKKGEIAPLPDDAPESAKQAQDEMLRKALGTPETAGDYQFKLPEGMEESGLDKELVGQLKAYAHENRMSRDTAQGLFDMALQREAAIHQSYEGNDQALIQKGHEALTKEYGADLPKKIEAAKRGVMLADPDIDVNTDPAFNHPTTVKLAIALAERTSDDSMPSGGQGGAASGMNFREQSRDIAQNPNNQWYKAYHDQSDPRHDAAVAEKTRLSKLAVKNKQS